MGDSATYADNIGLSAALRGELPPPVLARGLSRRTYSPLTRVSAHSDVEPSNAALNSLFRSRLRGYDEDLVARTCKVVGELHNNVASHADGVGFSAAQVYDGRRLVFAVADTGRGFLRNVRRADPNITCDDDAIGWAFVRGNTSARPRGDMEQRWAPGRDAREDDDNHQGLGLAIFEELVQVAKGSLWVLSGTAQRAMVAGAWVACDPPVISWPGVVLGLEIPLNRAYQPPDGTYTSYEDLKRELGL